MVSIPPQGAVTLYIAVVGPAEADPQIRLLAESTGRLIAQVGAILVTGGGTGAMEAACRGAKQAGGRTLGILPGDSRSESNRYVDIGVPTGMGEMRNALVVRSADGIIAVGGGYGTLSEIALALKLSKPLVGIRSWQATGDGGPAPIPVADDPEEAVKTVLELIGSTHR